MKGCVSPLWSGQCTTAVRTSDGALTPRDLEQCGWQCHAVEDRVAESSALRRWDAEQRWWLREKTAISMAQGEFPGANDSSEDIGFQDTSA